MFDFKNLFASKTVLTTLLGGLFSLLSAFGIISVNPETQAGIVTVLFAMAGFFRYIATKQLAVAPGSVTKSAETL